MTAPTCCPHQVQHHADDDTVGPDVAGFVVGSLLRGEAAVVIATADHRAAVATALAEAGVDLDEARTTGRLVELDAPSTLAGLRGPGGLDLDRFAALVPPMVDDLVARFGAVSAYGEMVGLLARDGDLASVLRLEELWVPLTRDQPLRLLCGYPTGSLDDEAAAAVDALHDATAEHVQATRGVRLPAGAEAAPLARSAVADVWGEWDLGPTELADDAELVVAELVGNAVRHVGSPAALTVEASRACVTVSVLDDSPEVPVPRWDPFAEGGRGCMIIDALADTWGVERLPRGKRVWARLRTSRP